MKKHFRISSSDNSQQLHGIMWAPEEGRPIGVMQLVHGMQEYIDRYDGFAQYLVSRGWAVIGHDHLGHGESGRWERGFFTERKDGAEVLIRDMQLITAEAKRMWPATKVFIFGHSMGSFFTRRYLTEYGNEVSGAIICGSGWYAPIATGTAYWAARVIGRIRGEHATSKLLMCICSAPFLFAFRSEGAGAWLSKNRENVARYKADPLCGFPFTCGGYRDMYRNLLLVSQGYHYEQLRPMPIMVISGSDDPVGGTQSVRRIAKQYRELGFADVTEQVLEGDRHEIFFEADAASAMSMVAEWGERRLNIKDLNIPPHS